MTRIVIQAFGTRGDVAPLTGLGGRLRQDLGVDVAIAAQHPYEEMITEADLEFRLLPNDTEQATRDSDYGQALVDGARIHPSKAALAAMRDDLAGVGSAMADASRDADLLLLEGPVDPLLGDAVGIVWRLLMPNLESRCPILNGGCAQTHPCFHSVARWRGDVTEIVRE